MGGTDSLEHGVLVANVPEKYKFSENMGMVMFIGKMETEGVSR